MGAETRALNEVTVALLKEGQGTSAGLVHQEDFPREGYVSQNLKAGCDFRPAEGSRNGEEHMVCTRGSAKAKAPCW